MVVVADGTIACASRARSIRFRHFGRFGMSAVRAEPFALWLGGQSDALEMEPLDFALLVVATDHLAKRYLDKSCRILVKSPKFLPGCRSNKSVRHRPSDFSYF